MSIFYVNAVFWADITSPGPLFVPINCFFFLSFSCLFLFLFLFYFAFVYDDNNNNNNNKFIVTLTASSYCPLCALQKFWASGVFLNAYVKWRFPHLYTNVPFFCPTDVRSSVFVGSRSLLYSMWDPPIHETQRPTFVKIYCNLLLV